MKVVLTIGGSDPTSGAGVQMDLKVFHSLGLYGVSVITAITAQNTRKVQAIYPLTAEQIDAQFRTLLNDINPYGAKIGMVYSAEAIDSIAKNIKKFKIKNLVVDPVLSSTTGRKLIMRDSINTLKEKLIPLSTALTANVPEAEKLTGLKINSVEEVYEALRVLLSMGTKFAIIKGGHFSDRVPDFLYDGKNFFQIEGEKFPGEFHGTGCAFSSAFLSFLCLGYEPREALEATKAFVKNALRNSMKLGKGISLLKI